MKKTCLLIALTVITLVSCTKKDNTTNNYYTLPANTQPAFLVQGINNISLVNDIVTSATLTITVQYQDSVQENVTLSFSGLPSGIVTDTTWIKRGIPTFSTSVTIYDTTAVGVTPGTYTVNLIATTASGNKKIYPFTLKIAPVPTTFFGKYAFCSSTCSSGGYSDSLYEDRNVANRVWFTNFANSGNMVFGMLNSDGSLTIPSQLSGGTDYIGASTGTINFSYHQLHLNYYSNSSSCSLTMN